MNLYPLILRPIFVEKIWGGRNLERLFAKALPPGKNIGESWELADLPEGVTDVANGPLAGRSLNELTAELGAELLGPAAPAEGGRFPLLLKLLDANDTLSLQVHPDAEAVRRIGGEARLKTECWYVAESREGYIYKGMDGEVSPEQFRKAIEENRAEQFVRRYDVATGEFHYLPAGTVHALGAGVVVAEVQTPSNTTYRVTDWGRGREIHVERSMECIHFEPASDQAPGARGETLLSTEFFDVRLLESTAGLERTFSAGRCRALMILSASEPIRLDCTGGGEPVGAQLGQTVLLPAGCGEVKLRGGGAVRILQADLPGND